MSENQRWVLARHPDGMVKTDDFRLESGPMPEPEDGEILVEVEYLAFEPAMRGWITGRDTYVAGIQVGDTMRGMGVGRVVKSRADGFAEGDRVTGGFGWQRFAAVPATGPMPPRVIPSGIDPTWPLSVLGITGLTAYFGLLDVGEPKAGETVLVSGAAGATGSVAAQIAKLKGCRVIGVAGGPEKCAWLTEKAQLDGAIDYKDDARPLAEQVRELCPDGIDVYFDNVGGELLDIALANLANRGRIVVCGAISSYNATELPPGPSNYTMLILKRGRMEGFIVLDYAAKFAEASAELAGWIRDGEIAFEVDVQEGFENAPATFLRLFQGQNLGKQLLKC